MIGVSKSTISQWELDKTYPKHRNFRALAQHLDCTITYLEKGIKEASTPKPRQTKSIPFCDNEQIVANITKLQESESFRILQVDDLPDKNFNDLICLVASGEAMEPVIKHGSLLVVDTKSTHIIDGKIYVFCQDDIIRVKLFSYEKNQVKLSSYNNQFKDEIYRFDELDQLRIIGQVVWFSTKLE